MDWSVSSRRVGVLSLTVAMLAAVLALSASPNAAGAAPAPPVGPVVGRVSRPPLPAVPPIVSGDPLPNAGPLAPPAAPSTPDAAPTPLDVALAQARKSGQRVEVPSLDSESATVFANPQGSLTQEVSAAPVRVRSGDGWVPVDPNLVVTPSGVKPKAVPGDVVLSPGGPVPLVSTGEIAPLGADGKTRMADQRLSLGVTAALPAPSLDGATATYPKALLGSDLVVKASPVGTEVSVVIPNRAAAQLSYVLDVSASGVTVKQGPAGTLVLTDEKGDETGYVSAPVMFDAAPSPLAGSGISAHPGKVTSKLVQLAGRSQLVITPDPAYLADPATKFPVTIDPLTDLGPSGDNSVYESVPNQNNSSVDTLFTGYTGFTGRARALLKFSPTTVIEDQLVTGATLKVWQQGGSCTPTPVRAQQVQTFYAGSTWNNQPAPVGPTIATVNTTGDTTGCPAQVGYKNFDVTALAQTWAGDAETSGSVALLGDETGQTPAKSFSSKEGAHPPVLSLDYLVYPDTPSALSPTAGSTVTTLQPTLKATVTAPNYSGNITANFKLFDDTNAQVGSYAVQVPSGTPASWLVPKDTLRPARTYTWKTTACTGYQPAACSSETSQTFIVSGAMASGQQGYFTYDSTPISDRSSLAVNVASGNLSVDATDLSLAGVNTPLSMTRTYNSLAFENRSYGRQWAGSYSDTVRLYDEADGSGSKKYYGPTGTVALIKKNSDGTYSPSGDVDARFSDGGGCGVYVLEFNHARDGHQAGDRLYFYNSGSLKNKLYGLENRNGQAITLTYSGTTVTQIVDTQSRGIAVATSGGRYTSASFQGRSTTFAYNSAGNLASVVDGAGKTTSYDTTRTTC